MVTLWKNGAYLLNGQTLIEDNEEAAGRLAQAGVAEDPAVVREAGRKQTMAYGILSSHNTSGQDSNLKIRFDKPGP